MKVQLNKKSFFILLILFFSLSQINSYSLDLHEYNLEIKENSGRFLFSKKNSENKNIQLFSDSDPRTSTFSIYENGGFYNLGDTFRYKKSFIEHPDGGVFNWTSKELFIEQVFKLDNNGFLEINFSLLNISTSSKTIGLKFLLDTHFEKEDYFYVMLESTGLEINNEYEIEDPADLKYWTSGVRNPTGSALMAVPTETIPSRIIFGNWKILNDATYYYKTVTGREFNKPPYSINDNAVLYLYSPKDLLPQNRMTIKLLFRAVDTVSDYSEIDFKDKNKIPDIIPEVVIPTILETVNKADDNPVVEEEINDLENIPIEDSLSEPVRDVIDNEITEKLNRILEIKDIIESISRPGIISEADLLKLEELINKLEEMNTK